MKKLKEGQQLTLVLTCESQSEESLYHYTIVGSNTTQSSCTLESLTNILNALRNALGEKQ